MVLFWHSKKPIHSRPPSNQSVERLTTLKTKVPFHQNYFGWAETWIYKVSEEYLRMDLFSSTCIHQTVTHPPTLSQENIFNLLKIFSYFFKNLHCMLVSFGVTKTSSKISFTMNSLKSGYEFNVLHSNVVQTQDPFRFSTISLALPNLLSLC